MMEKSQKYTRSSGTEDMHLLCPLCGRELIDDRRRTKGWDCKCGEFIPDKLMVDPFGGCTHGQSCNCGRERGH